MVEEPVWHRFWRYFNPVNIFKELLFGWKWAEGVLFLVLILLQLLVWTLGVVHNSTLDWFGLATGMMNIIGRQGSYNKLFLGPDLFCYVHAIGLSVTVVW